MWGKIIKASTYLLVFLVPLFWLPFSFEIFDFNKIYLLSFLTGIGVLAWFGRMIFEKKKIKFRGNLLDIFVLIFLAVMILNTVFSVDKTSSLYGFYGRFWPNLIGILSLGFGYFLITNNVTVKIKGLNQNSSKKEENLKEDGVINLSSLIKIFLWSGFFVTLTIYFSLFGVWSQLAKLISLPGVMMARIFNPIGASLEQGIMFLTIVFLLVLTILALREKEVPAKKKKGNFLLYLFLFAIFFLLILVDFWVSWLVIFLSLSLFLGVSLWKRIFREDVNRLSLTVLFLIISILLLFFNPLEKAFSGIPRLANLPKEVLLSQGITWQVGFQGLKEKVILGSGNGTFSFLFSKFKPQEMLNTPFWQIRFDRGGNHLGEMVGTTGLLGILSFLALIGIFLMISLMILALKPEISYLKVQLPLFIVVLSLFVSQFWYYQNTTLAVSFWVFLALGSLSWGKVQKEKIFELREFPELGLVFSILFWVFLIGLLFFYFTLGKHYLADVYYKKFLLNPQESNLAFLERAIRFNGARAEYHLALSRVYLRKISQELQRPQPDNQLVISTVALALREGRKSLELAPFQIAVKENLAIIYRDIQGLAQGATDWAIKMFEEALKLEPKNPVFLTELGKLKILIQKQKEAEDLFKKALQLKEDYLPPAIQLALLKEREGKEQEAIKELAKLVEKYPFSIEARFQLGRLYYNQKEDDKAEEQFLAVIILFPNHSNSHYSLGLIYERKGEKDKALKEFEKVLELNPGNKEIKRKIAELKREK